MKTAKRIAGVLLALLTVLAMACPAFAAPTESTGAERLRGELATMEGTLDGGKITVNKAVPGQTYNLYQILYLESYVKNDTAGTALDGTDRYGNYVYKPTSVWTGFLSSTPKEEGDQNDPLDFFTIDNGYAAWSGDVSRPRVQAFAQLALRHAKADAAIKPVATYTVAEGEASFSFENLKLGYYLIDSTVGTLCELYTTNDVITIDDKNTPPTITKTVNENGTNGVKTNDTSVGSEIKYMSTINAKNGAQGYVFHDVMPESVDYVRLDEITHRKGAGVEDKPLVAYTDEATPYDYKVIRPAEGKTALDDGCTFHVEFHQNFLATLDLDSYIDIDYTGRLNIKAAVGGTRPANITTNEVDPRTLVGAEAKNVNKCWLMSGENSTIKSIEDCTYTYTWEFMFHKIAFKSNTNAMDQTKAENVISLAGAEFNLTVQSDTAQTPLKFTKLPAEDGVAGDIYILDPNNGTETLTTPASGKVTIRGLDAGSYYLHETKAPAGYNKLSSPVEVKIDSFGKVYQGNTVAANGHIDIQNNSGSLMPSTGGIGTTIFYIVGGVLLVGAGVLLVVRKRMNGSKAK